MFEKEAEEYAEEHAFRVPYDGSNKFYDDVDFKASKEGYLAGAEFGYNKANKWHYVKDEGTPTKEGHYLVCLRNKDHDVFDCWIFVSDNVSYSLKVRMKDIYAWKEIVLPKESE